MRRRDFLAGAASVPVALTLVSCGGGGDATAPAPPPPPPPPPPTDVPGATVTVLIEDNAFVDPDGGRNGDAQVSIRSGETVGWRHVGENPHTVTSTTVPSGARSFESATMRNGDTFTLTPTTPGTYTYHCATHPGSMVDARVIVT